VLATSRVPLNLDGEWILRIGPIDEDERLFLSRTRAALGGDDLPETDLQAVKRVLPRLNGIPLAIEMAAASVPALGMDGLERKLNEVASLASSRLDHQGRQSDLFHVIGTSLDLLSRGTRDLLERLWPFEAGFTFETATRLTDEDADGAVQELQDLSLVHVLDTFSGVRLSVLRVVREYVEGVLEPERKRQTIRALAGLFHGQGSADNALGYHSEEDFAKATEEAPNIMSVACLAARHQLPDLAADLLSTHYLPLRVRGIHEQVYKDVVALGEQVDDLRRMRLATIEGYLALLLALDAPRQQRALDRIVELGRRLNDPRYLALGYAFQANRAGWFLHDTDLCLRAAQESRRYAERMREEALADRDYTHVGHAWFLTSSLFQAEGRWEEALEALYRARWFPSGYYTEGSGSLRPPPFILRAEVVPLLMLGRVADAERVAQAFPKEDTSWMRIACFKSDIVTLRFALSRTLVPDVLRDRAFDLADILEFAAFALDVKETAAKCLAAADLWRTSHGMVATAFAQDLRSRLGFSPDDRSIVDFEGLLDELRLELNRF
ncbi:MAG TPA: hypothetical protein VGE01_14265, partial [Fimbriimonas sp.]